MYIKVTGGPDFIGNLSVQELIGKNHEVVITDNLSNLKIEVLKSSLIDAFNNCLFTYTPHPRETSLIRVNKPLQTVGVYLHEH